MAKNAAVMMTTRSQSYKYDSAKRLLKGSSFINILVKKKERRVRNRRFMTFFDMYFLRFFKVF